MSDSKLNIKEMDNSPDSLRAIINDSKRTHEEWLKYYGEVPDAIGKYDDSAGGPEHQAYCIEKYEKALACISSMEDAMSLLHARIMELEGDVDSRPESPNKELVEALEKIIKIRNLPHRFNAMGKCSDMFHVARKAIYKYKETP